MSAYTRNKAIMYPLDKDTLNKLGVEDAWDLVDKFPEINNFGSAIPYFEIEAMVDDDWECTHYLSYVLYHTYGKEFGEFGRNRLLTSTEQEKYKAIFEKIIPDIDVNKLKYVDYCYYNASESPDFYNQADDFNSEI